MLFLKTKLERSVCTKLRKWGCLTVELFRRSGIFVFYFIFATMIYHPCYTVLNGMYIHVYVNNDIPPLLHCFKWYVHTCILQQWYTTLVTLLNGMYIHVYVIVISHTILLKDQLVQPFIICLLTMYGLHYCCYLQIIFKRYIKVMC